MKNRSLLTLHLLLLTALSISSAAQLTTLVNFNNTDGASPYGTLTQGADGDFYGTTQFGGAYSQGEVFKVDSLGDVTVLYSFCSDVHTCSDGGQPFDGLTLGSDGNFYGTTGGTFFSITPSGTLTTLHKFCSLPGCADGQFPYDRVVQGKDGNFYGTTCYGGVATLACGSTCGTIFKITPAGALTTIYSFRGKDGALPIAGLVQGSDGNFYGVTTYGGRHSDGAVFKITPSGTYTLLHSFGGLDGASPNGDLIQAKDGNFYGTTFGGGTYQQGVVFKITASGKLTVLRSFDQPNGAFPYAGLIQATDGNLYGSTYKGGAQNHGTVFRITTTGKLTTLYNFCSLTNCADGSQPYAAPTQGSDGNLYGSTLLGGSGSATSCGPDGSCGTVFRLPLHLSGSKE